MRDEYDFTDSQRGAIVKSNKERITIRLDPDIIEWFRGRVRGGGPCASISSARAAPTSRRRCGVCCARS